MLHSMHVSPQFILSTHTANDTLQRLHVLRMCYTEYTFYRVLLEAGADIEATDEMGNTALIMATKENHLESIDALIR